MTEEDTNKVTIALANSFLQNVTLSQVLMIVQEKSLERAQEEVKTMEEPALEELLTNIRAQEIAQELRDAPSPEASPDEAEATEATEALAEETAEETAEEETAEESSS